MYGRMVLIKEGLLRRSGGRTKVRIVLSTLEVRRVVPSGVHWTDLK